MKKMNKIVALFVAAVMCLTLSVSVFATSLDVEQDVYTLGIGVFDENGNLITKAEPGDKVYIGEVIYVTEGKADLAIEANKNASLEYAIMIDARLATEYTGAEEETMTDVKACEALISDAEEFKVIFVNASIANTACVFGADKAVTMVGITLPEEEATYEFSVFEDSGYTFTADAETYANFAIAGATTLTVEAGGNDAPTFDATTAGATDGVAIKDTDKKFDNAFAVSATIKPGSATEVGMLFVPEAVNNWEAAAVATYGGKVAGEGTVTFTAAIKNIPRAFQGKDLVMLSKAYAKVGDVVSYGNEVKTTINFGSTGEVE